MTAALSSTTLFGYGERNNKNLKLKDGTYTIYGRDDPSLVDTG